MDWNKLFQDRIEWCVIINTEISLRAILKKVGSHKIKSPNLKIQIAVSALKH
jgi:hypothetical protein